ncbi:hypothetical protein [Bacillus sp. NEB1478]|uniref:hypothetical protein n=1 Tax=Bacillus sp. NEB1478 TaxID=3073816 RepID=UPI002873CD2A|nr:hypothetical protein [Bacillus sp. NEB1478]WNB92444.1 hypothetical protein RGB74_01910 [Bacillus sp. NEB1478]
MKRVIAVVLFISILTVGAYIISRDQPGFNITIKNQTNKNISDLKITYQNITSDIEIPSIQPKEEYKLKVTPTEEFGENTMKLLYTDDKGTLHTKTVIGYFEQGYSGESMITLQAIDTKGVIQMDIKEELFN